MKLGTQEPRVLVAPSPKGWTTYDGQDASAFAARFRLVLDPWQDTTVEAWCRRDKRGRWCASTWGITVARQNGKNGGLEAVELYGMVVLGLRFLHTAHEVKTARKAFKRLQYFFGEKANDPNAKFPELNALVAEVRNTNGQEAILLKSGASIEFVARSKGSGRGFTVDVLVLDEAQDLRDEQLEALLPTISAAPSGDPVTIYMGTPPTDEALTEGGRGEPFLRVRNGALLGTAKRTAWVEFSLDVDLDQMSDEEIAELVADRANWYLTNPTLGRRIQLSSIEGEWEKFSARSFARERLNVWPVPQGSSRKRAFSGDLWRDLSIPAAPESWPLAAVGLDMDASGRLWTAFAAHGPDPSVHVEVLPDDLLAAGADAAVRWIVQRCRKRLPVVMPADSGASVLEPALRGKGVKVYRLNATECTVASAGLAQAMKDGEVSHLADPLLEKAIGEATREDEKAGGWRIGRAGEWSGAPEYAVACARLGAVKWSRRAVPRGESVFR